MNRFSARQITLGAVVVTIVLMASLFIATQYLFRNIDRLVDQERHLNHASNVFQAARYHVVQIQQFLTDVGATADPGGFADAEAHLGELRQELTRLKQMDGGYGAAIDKIIGSAEQLHRVGVQMAHAYIDAGREAGNRIMKAPGSGLDDTSAQLAQRLDELAQAIEPQRDAASDKLDAYAETAVSSSMLFSLLVTLFLMAVLALLYHKLIPPLRKLAESMNQLSTGHADLSLTLDATGQDEIAHVSASFNRFVDLIHRLIRQVARTTGDLGHSGDQMSVVSQQTLTGMDSLQSTTGQVATAVNQMAATVQEVATNAGRAAEAAGEADREAARGQQVVAETTQSITRLSGEVEAAAKVIGKLHQDADNIGGILDVIRAIADQTNLLALNAAIEAARAGEQGRGFAVVADEVRSLAQKTQDSTQEIQAMIHTLQGAAKEAVTVMGRGRGEAERSVEQARLANESLLSITSAVGVISDMNAQIASASEEQSAVAETINRSVVAISQVAAETSHQAHQGVDVSTHIGDLLAQLNTQVQQFRFSQDHGLDLSAAKTAHLAWKSRLRSFLDGQEFLKPEQAVSHHHCDFGRWYYLTGMAEYSQHAVFKAIEPPHAELHRLIQRIVELRNQGEMEQAEREYAKVGPLSTKIVGLLEQLERDAA